MNESSILKPEQTLLITYPHVAFVVFTKRLHEPVGWMDSEGLPANCEVGEFAVLETIHTVKAEPDAARPVLEYGIKDSAFRAVFLGDGGDHAFGHSRYAVVAGAHPQRSFPVFEYAFDGIAGKTVGSGVGGEPAIFESDESAPVRAKPHRSFVVFTKPQHVGERQPVADAV